MPNLDDSSGGEGALQRFLAENASWTPRPDPTKLTTDTVNAATAQYRRELDALREVLSQRITQGIEVRDTGLASLRESLSTRLDAMDKAAEVLEQTVNRTPTLLQTAVANLRDVYDERLASQSALVIEHKEAVEIRFRERDVRGEQTAAAREAALSAALQAAKEAVAEQVAVAARATDKAEESFQTTISSLRDIYDQRFLSMQQLINERFTSVAQQFTERDTRTEQSATASASALAAALQAAKEAVFEQAQAAAKAAEKTELSFALALDTPIFTADGWKTMGTVKAGDTVFAEDGEPTSVIATSRIFPDSSCYAVQFSDGSRIVATGDHRWHVYDVCARRRGKRGTWKTLTTQEIIDSGWHRLRNGSNGYRYRIATNAVVQTPEVKLPIDPYIFGYWLGDGSSGSPKITVGNEDKKFVIAQIEDAGYRIAKETEQVSDWGTSWALYLTNDERWGAGLNALLGQLGVRGPGRKHVPGLYLAASPGQRRALLAGLLDSDGTISKAASRVTFNSTSTPLAEGVRQVARSLGYRAVLHRYGDDYHVTWPPTENVFRNPRKVALFRPSTTRQREWASITDIQPALTVPTRCLTVEHPSHVFLVGCGFIPTCNTKQIDAIGLQIKTVSDGFGDRIGELKERIDRGEGSSVGAIGQRTETRLNIGTVISIGLFAISLITFIILYVTKKLPYVTTRRYAAPAR